MYCSVCVGGAVLKGGETYGPRCRWGTRRARGAHAMAAPAAAVAMKDCSACSQPKEKAQYIRIRAGHNRKYDTPVEEGLRLSHLLLKCFTTDSRLTAYDVPPPPPGGAPRLP